MSYNQETHDLICAEHQIPSTTLIRMCQAMQDYVDRHEFDLLAIPSPRQMSANVFDWIEYLEYRGETYLGTIFYSTYHKQYFVREWDELEPPAAAEHVASFKHDLYSGRWAAFNSHKKDQIDRLMQLINN